MPREQQREIIAALVDHIEAQPAANGSLDLHIHWRDGSTATAKVPGHVGASLRWTAEEDARIIALFRQATTQVEIARVLPGRTWGSIEQRYWQLVKPSHRVKLRRKRVMETGETYADFTFRTRESSYQSEV